MAAAVGLLVPAIARNKKTRLGGLCDQWLLTKRGLELTSYSSYEAQIRLYIKPVLGMQIVSEIRPADVQLAMDTWQSSPRFDGKKGSRSTRTVRLAVSVLSMIFAYGKAIEVCTYNPVQDIQRPRVKRSRSPLLNVGRAREVLQALGGTMLGLPAWLAFAQGVRRGELLALERGDINLRQSEMYVRRALACRGRDLRVKAPKTAKSVRRLPLSPNTVRLLADHLANQEQRLKRLGIDVTAQTPLFDDGVGRWWHPDAFGKEYRKALQRSNIEPLPLRYTRHTFASVAAAVGAQSTVVRDLLGHETTQITDDIYTQTTEFALRQVVERVTLALQA